MSIKSPCLRNSIKLCTLNHYGNSSITLHKVKANVHSTHHLSPAAVVTNGTHLHQIYTQKGMYVRTYTHTYTCNSISELLCLLSFRIKDRNPMTMLQLKAHTHPITQGKEHPSTQCVTGQMPNCSPSLPLTHTFTTGSLHCIQPCSIQERARKEYLHTYVLYVHKRYEYTSYVRLRSTASPQWR